MRQPAKKSAFARELFRVDKQRRIDVNPLLVEATLGAKFAPGKTVHLWALTGPDGQLQLLGPENELAQLRDSFESLPANRRPLWDAGADEDTAAYRKLAGFFRVACRRRTRGDKLRVTFPADAVDLGVIKTEEKVAVFANGELLEFWRKDLWQEANSIQDLRQFTEEARKSIESAD